jgi:hypothetical protein
MPHLISSSSKARVALGLGAVAVVSIGTALGQSLQIAATTATPKVSGTYAIAFTSICQQQLTINQNGQNGVVSVGFSGQDTSQHAGTITFAPAAATPLAGAVTLSSSKVQGAPLTVNGGGDAFGLSSQSASGTYAMTATTITILGTTYNYYHGSVAGGIVQQFTFVGVEGGCSSSGMGVHQ